MLLNVSTHNSILKQTIQKEISLVTAQLLEGTVLNQRSDQIKYHQSCRLGFFSKLLIDSEFLLTLHPLTGKVNQHLFEHLKVNIKETSFPGGSVNRPQFDWDVLSTVFMRDGFSSSQLKLCYGSSEIVFLQPSTTKKKFYNLFCIRPQ